MKSPNLKKCVQQHINSSNLTSQLRAVSHGKNPFQTTHELISLSHAFNYLLFRERNKLSSPTTRVNQTQVDSPQVCAFQCHIYLTVLLLCFEQSDRSSVTASLQNSPVPACRAGTEGQQACDFTSVILSCTVAELWEQDQEVSVATGHAGDQHRSRPPLLPSSLPAHGSSRTIHPRCTAPWEATRASHHFGVRQMSGSWFGQELSPTQSPGPRTRLGSASSASPGELPRRLAAL